MSKRQSNPEPPDIKYKPPAPPGPPEPNDFLRFVEDHRRECIEIMAIPYHLLCSDGYNEEIINNKGGK